MKSKSKSRNSSLNSNSKPTSKNSKVIHFVTIDGNRPETRIQQEFREKWAAKQTPLTEGLDTGIYELQSVVTHLGNSVESGHYMAWIKENDE